MARLFNDASSQYLSRGTFASVTTPFTVSCWIYIDTYLATRQRIIWLEDDDAGLKFYLVDVMGSGEPPGNALLCNHFDGSHAAANTTTSISLNTWHHVCAVFANTSSRTIFLDAGGATTNNVLQNVITCDILEVGRGLSEAYVSGRIAEVAIHNAALTVAEVTALAKGYSPLFVHPQSLVSYWPIIGRTSPEIDLVGGYDLTLVNAPTTAAHPRIIYPQRQQFGIPTTAATGLSVNISRSANYIQVVTP